MATFLETTIQQSTGEIRSWTADFTDDLPTGGTVTAGTAVHTPPSGTASTPLVSYTSPYVTAQVGPLSVTGIHYLDIQATYSDGQKGEVRIAFSVNYPTSTARSGMTTLIDNLRGMTNTGPNDYTIAGVPYWTDRQLQTALDKYRTEVRREELISTYQYTTAGSVEYTRYYSRYGNFEQTTGGTAIFWLQDGTHAIAGTATYTVDYIGGVIDFVTDTTGVDYYLYGYSYDLNRAAADIWRQKAGQVSAGAFSWSTDNMRIDKSGLRKEYLAMADYYLSLAGPASSSMIRSDTDA